MDYITVVKTANHVYDGICHPDIGQELVAQAFAPAGTLHQTGDVHEFDHGGGILLWTVHFCQPVQTLIRDRYHTDVGVNGAERIVGTFRSGIGNGVEQSGFSHIGKSHDT